MKWLILITVLYYQTAFSQSYTVGKSWDKKPIQKIPTKFHPYLQSIGEIGSSATTFYIGHARSKYYVITNSHVCPNKQYCLNKRVEFPYYRNQRGSSLKAFVINTPIIETSLDFALLEIQFQNLDTFSKPPMALKLSSKIPQYLQPLISSGYGSYENEYGVLKTEISGDCRVFSKANDLRRIADPDETNPFPFLVHSFLIGCDVSHGDSGSPILDLRTGKVLGLLWTGKMPKDKAIRTPNLTRLPYNYLWTQLNYAVPSFMIKRLINRYLKTLNNSQ